MQSKYWMQRLADEFDLNDEHLPGLPVIELAGDKRVLIERHRGIVEYSSERIGVRVRYGTVCVHGCGLEVCRMTKEQIVITGRVDDIRLQRR